MVSTPLCFSLSHQIQGKPLQWEPRFSSHWVSQEGSLQTLRDHVTGGGAFVAAAMSSPHRSSSAFRYADLAAVDIDSGLSVDDFLAHPLAAQACWVYTTASHDPENGKHRFRVLFRLPHRTTNAELFKAITTLLTRSLGGDKSCSDACRLFYGNAGATSPLWQPEAVLADQILHDAEQELSRSARRFNPAQDHDPLTIERAIFVLEQVLPPTQDGERNLFVRVTAAASAGGEPLFAAWQNWASSGHHGKGRNAWQTTEKFFNGFHKGSSLATLFFLASEANPEWRSLLPEELSTSGPLSSGRPANGCIGYDHLDFLDDPFAWEPGADPDTETTSLFDAERPWTKIATPEAATAKPSAPVEADPDADPSADDDFLADDPQFDGTGAAPKAAGGGGGSAPARGGRSKAGGGNRDDDDEVSQVQSLLRVLYPGLRLNLMSQELEYGPKDKPDSIYDVSTAYVRISKGQKGRKTYAKTLVYDVASVVGYENRYHPVKNYLESCAANVKPCPYFARLASELLGLPQDDPIRNPSMPSGRLLADVALERFMIGAVARVMEPGCTMDWMPILVGSQNSGKSNFFQYLTPPSHADPGIYPWVSTIQQDLAYIKNKPHVLHAGWIVVLDEIERFFKRSNTEDLKNLISVATDRSARKYENDRAFRRSFVLGGATNSADFLVDPTGNRRFLPINVTGVVPAPEDPRITIIDLDRLKQDRDSIWAAAVGAYLSGAPRLFSSHELAFVKEYVDQFSSDSPLDSRLQKELSLKVTGVYQGRNYITLGDVFTWLEIPLASARSVTMELTDCLKRLGWQSKSVRINGRVTRIWLAPLA